MLAFSFFGRAIQHAGSSFPNQALLAQAVSTAERVWGLCRPQCGRGAARTVCEE